MKQSLSLQHPFLVLACCIVGAGSNDDEVIEKNSGEWVGAVRPCGEEVGDATYFDTEQAGGTIQSTSADIVIKIHEGALQSDFTITLQAVANTAPNGTGQSYRLTLHDVSLQKYNEGASSFC